MTVKLQEIERLAPRLDWLSVQFRFPGRRTPLDLEEAIGFELEPVSQWGSSFENKEVGLYAKFARSGKKVEVQFRGLWFIQEKAPELALRVIGAIRDNLASTTPWATRVDVQTDYFFDGEPLDLLPPRTKDYWWSFLSGGTRLIPKYVSFATGEELVTGFSIISQRWQLIGYRSDIEKADSDVPAKRQYYAALYGGRPVSRIELRLRGKASCALATAQMTMGQFQVEDLLAEWGRSHSIRRRPRTWDKDSDKTTWRRAKDFDWMFFIKDDRPTWRDVMPTLPKGDLVFEGYFGDYARAIRHAVRAAVAAGKMAVDVKQAVDDLWPRSCEIDSRHWGRKGRTREAFAGLATAHDDGEIVDDDGDEGWEDDKDE